MFAGPPGLLPVQEFQEHVGFYLFLLHKNHPVYNMTRHMQVDYVIWNDENDRGGSGHECPFCAVIRTMGAEVM